MFRSFDFLSQQNTTYHTSLHAFLEERFDRITKRMDEIDRGLQEMLGNYTREMMIGFDESQHELKQTFRDEVNELMTLRSGDVLEVEHLPDPSFDDSLLDAVEALVNEHLPES